MFPRLPTTVSFMAAFFMAAPAKADELSGPRVGAAAVNLTADATMVLAGSIGPRYADEQVGELRAIAVVCENPGDAKLAIVA